MGLPGSPRGAVSGEAAARGEGVIVRALARAPPWSPAGRRRRGRERVGSLEEAMLRGEADLFPQDGTTVAPARGKAAPSSGAGS